MVRHRAASSAERERGKNANFQIRMKYSGWSQPGMRRECTRMYGAASGQAEDDFPSWIETVTFG